MKKQYIVICFTDVTKRATIDKTFETLTDANKFIKSQHGKHEEIILRLENIYVDTPNTTLSTSGIIKIFNRNGEITYERQNIS